MWHPALSHAQEGSHVQGGASTVAKGRGPLSINRQCPWNGHRHESQGNTIAREPVARTVGTGSRGPHQVMESRSEAAR